MRCRNHLRAVLVAFCFALALALVGARSAGAQAVRGIVVDPADRPVNGVVVLLLDSASRVVGRALSNADGEFRVAAPRAGTFRLRTMRIGFRPTSSEPIALAAGAEVSRRAVLSGVQVTLDTMQVVDRSACRGLADSTSATFTAWEQARTALSAAQVTAASRALAVTLVTYDRTYDRTGREILAEQAKASTGYMTQPWRSLPADSLHRVGYVEHQPGETTVYQAPAIDVLLSDSFLADHCFRLTAERDSASVGISFEPAASRTLPDVAGTIWLDRRSAELRRLEFRYVNIPRAQAEQAGGATHFARLASGDWVIARWSIRMPLLEEAKITGTTTARDLRVAEVHEMGGELALVRRGRDTVWIHEPMVLAGSVVSAVNRRPVAGGNVRIRGTSLFARTDSAGLFAIPGVLPGEYTLDLRTPALDSLGVLNTFPVTLADSAARFQLEAKRPAAVGGVFAGLVLIDSARTPIQGAEVRVIDADKAAITDASGRFRIPGVPAGEHQILVRRVGFGPLETRLAFAENRTVDRTVYLSRVVLLDSVVVQSKSTMRQLEDFEANRRMGLGHFFTRDSLDKLKGYTLTEVLRETAGVNIVIGRGNHSWVAGNRGGRSLGAMTASNRDPEKAVYPIDAADAALGAVSGCYATVYLDEVRVYTPQKGRSQPLFDLSMMAPDQIEAIEVYAGPAQTPAKYAGLNSECGVLVIHTRKTP